MSVETRTDGFLDGRLRIAQPLSGYRAGADAVMLAAACPAKPGEAVLDLGCGVGVAALCLGARVPEVRLTGLERQPGYAALAAQNAEANGIAVEVVTGDLATMPASLRERSFDQVIANPPYFRGGTPAPDAGRAVARLEETALALWVSEGLRRLRPGGRLVMIHRPERLGDLLSALQDKAGDVAILPLAGRTGAEAGRVIVGARKGARGPLRLLAPVVLHDGPVHPGDHDNASDFATAILRRGAEINLW